MRVLKFGGTSVATADRIRRSAGIVSEAASRDRVVVVVSALAGVTDILVDVADRTGRGESCGSEVEMLRHRHLECLQQLASNGHASPASRALTHRLDEVAGCLAEAASRHGCPPAARDRVLATGERLSVLLVTAALRGVGLNAEPVDASDLVRTDSNFGEARVDPEATATRVVQRLGTLPPHTVPVVTGFIGADDTGRTTTLGRGGSDYTASLLGAALSADVVEIWTDVDGVLTGPPRLVRNAVTISRLTYEEAAELAFFGAKVLHRDTMRPLCEKRIPILVRNAAAPERAGTFISEGTHEQNPAIRAVTAVEHVTRFTLPQDHGGARWDPALWPQAGRVRLPTDVLAVAQASARRAVCLVVPAARAEAAAVALGDEVGVERRDHLALVAAVGHGIAEHPGLAVAALTVLMQGNISLAAAWAGASPHSATALVEHRDLGKAIGLLHDHLVLASPRAGIAGSRGTDEPTGGRTDDAGPVPVRTTRLLPPGPDERQEAR